MKELPLGLAGASLRQPLGLPHSQIASFSTEDCTINQPTRGNVLISIILPAKNEAAALQTLLPRLRAAQPSAEIIVVDDGSTDATTEVCVDLGVRSVTQPYSMGNGAAIKRGARAAAGDTLVFMDADGQHDPAD